MMFKRMTADKTGRRLLSTAAAALLFGAGPAFAQDTVSDEVGGALVTVKMLVDAGIVTPDQARKLAAMAKAQGMQPAAAPPAEVAMTPPPAGTVRIPYVPEELRSEIKDELRQEVLAQAKSEGWAAPGGAAPEWTRNIRIHGDFRFRSASALYGRDNATGFYVDVPTFNATGPYDVSGFGNQLLPTINTTRDKINNLQLRARIGIEADVVPGIQLGFQLATGDNAGPISTNATLTGGFAKRDVWIQNAFARAELIPGLVAMAGRFDNPFRTTDLMFDPDLALDGVYGEARSSKLLGEKSFGGLDVAVRGGAFPIQFEDGNFPSTSPNKRNWRDRYLFTGQAELGYQFAGGVKATVWGAYHNFTYLRGHVSAPCDVFSATNVECSTDQLRPLFATKGNTLMYLRRIDTTFAPDPANPIEPQYLGLKFAYRVLDVGGSLSVPISSRIQARLTGNYLYNFGFDPRNICREGPDGQPRNNVQITDPANPNQGACDATNPARFVGGNEGYGIYFNLGDPNLFSINPRRAARGAWAINAAYKYLQSDAVPDSFTDSDFHLGGTNAKGYIIGGAWAPYDRVSLGARWFSSDTIVDAPLAIDVLLLDLGFAF